MTLRGRMKQMKRSKLIGEGWQIHSFPPDGFSPSQLPEDGWIPANVPGDVHTTLMAHGLIGDPAVGTDDSACAWVEEQIWVYRCSFSITPQMAGAEQLRLRFEGLDTLCQVFVDGKIAGKYENMFVEHTLPLKGMTPGEHKLMLVFLPVCRFSRQEELPPGFWINYSLERAFVRKAGYMFGWDWTPRVITCGVWKPVYLEWVSGAEMGRLQARTVSASDACAVVAVSCPVYGGSGQLHVSLWDQDRCVAQATPKEGKALLEVENPRLWWTHDQGEPFLYTLRARLTESSGETQEQRIPLGIRTVSMQTEAADGSPRYVTLLNGRPIFLKGANWVPMSNRPSTVTARQYDDLLTMARAAGMNALSLWGGGIYEGDDFYRLCDEKGLLCWQYFMFACGEYPDWDEAFLRNVRDEVEKVIDRLQSHCCIALWIGNVESEMLCHKIGLNRSMHGRRLFEELLPAWVAELMPGAVYVPSSPWGGEQPNSMAQGDRHNWDVWFKDLPYTEYEKDTAAFCSEFGLHGAPVMESIRAFTGEKDPRLDSFLFGYFNRDQDLSRMDFYLNEVTGRPRDMREYVRFSMLIQAEGLACGAEHFRRRFPECGGSLIWQLNDCCLCHSWSLVDAHGIPKAAYYEAKRFFAPVLVSLKEDGNATQVWVTNQSADAIRDTVYLEVGDFIGRRVLEKSIPVAVEAGESKCVDRFLLGGRYAPNIIIGNRPRLYYAAAWLSGQQRFAKRFFEKQKYLLLPPATLTCHRQENAWLIRTDVYARQVAIDGDLEGLELSDNWFDLRPGQQRSISIRARSGRRLDQRRLTLSALNAAEQALGG